MPIDQGQGTTQAAPPLHIMPQIPRER